MNAAEEARRKAVEALAAEIEHEYGRGAVLGLAAPVTVRQKTASQRVWPVNITADDFTEG